MTKKLRVILHVFDNYPHLNNNFKEDVRKYTDNASLVEINIPHRTITLTESEHRYATKDALPHGLEYHDYITYGNNYTADQLLWLKAHMRIYKEN